MKYVKCCAILFLPFFLLSCSRPPTAYLPKDTTNPLPTRISGSSDKRLIELQEKFSSQGAQVITIGQDYMISIPSHRIFADQSPRVHWTGYGILNDAVTFLQQMRTVAVTVSSYSSPYISSARERSLTIARAEAVTDYLWSQGIDSRFIFAEGVASQKPIVSRNKGGDFSANSRIEITFREAIV